MRKLAVAYDTYLGEFKSGWMVNNVIYIQTNGGREADQKQQTHIWQQTEVKKSTEDQQRQMNRTGQVTSVSMFFMLVFSQLE